MFIVEFSFVKYEVREIFNSILMYIFHEFFDVRFRDFEVREFLDGVFVYMASRTPAVIVITRLVFQPVLWMAWFSGSYLICFCVMACSGNLSWQ